MLTISIFRLGIPIFSKISFTMAVDRSAVIKLHKSGLDSFASRILDTQLQPNYKRWLSNFIAGRKDIVVLLWQLEELIATFLSYCFLEVIRD